MLNLLVLGRRASKKHSFSLFVALCERFPRSSSFKLTEPSFRVAEKNI
jgi:hypothetical protein